MKKIEVMKNFEFKPKDQKNIINYVVAQTIKRKDLLTLHQLFENDILAARLQNLERFNYDSLLAFYNTETPVVIIDNIVHMSGCKQHDCPSNAYDFFIDVENDNINVYHFRSNMLKVYQEKGWIDLPPAFAEEMEIKKSNAKIGEIDDTESTYSLTVEQ